MSKPIDDIDGMFYHQVIQTIYDLVKGDKKTSIKRIDHGYGRRLCRLISKERDLQYDFVDWIAYGGEALVLEANQIRPGKARVAIKVAAPMFNAPGKRDIYNSGTSAVRYTVDERNEFFLRFKRGMLYQRDIAHSIDLAHGYIPKILLFSERPLYFVMEYIHGVGFDKWVQRANLKTRLNFLAQIYKLIDELHRCFVVHRDIKPNNIIVSQGKPVVIDFTVAKSLKEIVMQDDTGQCSDIDDNTLVTQIMMGIGNKFYASPEMQTDISRADHRSDIFSCGKMLEFAYNRLPPLQGSNQGKRLPDPLRKIFHQATQFDMSHRYQYMAYMVEDYDKALSLLDLKDSGERRKEKEIEELFTNFRYKNIAVPLYRAISDIYND